MKKLTADQLDVITNIIIDIVRDENIMYSDIREVVYNIDGQECDIIDILVSLHNVLYREVTGELYDYMFHWANKIGSFVEDSLFIDEE